MSHICDTGLTWVNEKKILPTTRQPKKLRHMLVRAKFEIITITKVPKLTGLFLCNNGVYHKAGYIIPCLPFSFKLSKGKSVSRTYKNNFPCIFFVNIIFLFWFVKLVTIFFLDKIKILYKQRILKHKSDIKNVHNSTCRVFPEHPKDCTQAKLNISILLQNKYCVKRIWRKTIYSQMESSTKLSKR